MLSTPWRAQRQLGIAYNDGYVPVVLLEKSASRLYCRPLTMQSSIQSMPELPALLNKIRAQIGHASIVLGLPTHCLMQQEVQLDPQLSSIEIQFYIEKNCLQLFGVDLSQLYYDWEFFMSESSKPKLLRIQAIQRTLLQPLLDVCKESGFHLTAIETNMHACQRLLHHLQLLSTELVGVVDLNKKATTLAVMQNNNLLFNKATVDSVGLLNLLNHFDTLYPHYSVGTLYMNGATTIPTELTAQITTPIHRFNLSSLLLPAFDNEFSDYASACGLALRGYTLCQ